MKYMPDTPPYALIKDMYYGFLSAIGLPRTSKDLNLSSFLPSSLH